MILSHLCQTYNCLPSSRDYHLVVELSLKHHHSINHMAATSSCEDFLAQALLSLKESPTSFNITSSTMTTTDKSDHHRQSSLKGCCSSDNNTTSFVYIPPLLMEPSLQDSYSDLNQYEKLQLKSLTDGSSVSGSSSSSLLLRKKQSITTMMNTHTPSLFHTTTTTSSAATTSQQRHDILQRSDMDRKQNWDLISPVGISKPRKMISRWYAESGSSSLVGHPSLLNTTTTTTSVSSNHTTISQPLPSNNTKLYHTRSVTDSSQVYQHHQSDRSDSSTGEEDDMEEASNADDDFIVSSEEDAKKSTPQKKRKTTIRKKKKHTTKGQFNTGWWSDDEHLRFLKGLKECGHNWSLISTKYVKTRGRRQCASHAQKWYQSERYAEEREKMDSL